MKEGVAVVARPYGVMNVLVPRITRGHYDMMSIWKPAGRAIDCLVEMRPATRKTWPANHHDRPARHGKMQDMMGHRWCAVGQAFQAVAAASCPHTYAILHRVCSTHARPPNAILSLHHRASATEYCVVQCSPWSAIKRQHTEIKTLVSSCLVFQLMGILAAAFVDTPS